MDPISNVLFVCDARLVPPNSHAVSRSDSLYGSHFHFHVTDPNQDSCLISDQLKDEVDLSLIQFTKTVENSDADLWPNSFFGKSKKRYLVIERQKNAEQIITDMCLIG